MSSRQDSNRAADELADELADETVIRACSTRLKWQRAAAADGGSGDAWRLRHGGGAQRQHNGDAMAAQQQRNIDAMGDRMVAQ